MLRTKQETFAVLFIFAFVLTVLLQHFQEAVLFRTDS